MADRIPDAELIRIGAAAYFGREPAAGELEQYRSMVEAKAAERQSPAFKGWMQSLAVRHAEVRVQDQSGQARASHQAVEIDAYQQRTGHVIARDIPVEAQRTVQKYMERADWAQVEARLQQVTDRHAALARPGHRHAHGREDVERER